MIQTMFEPPTRVTPPTSSKKLTSPSKVCSRSIEVLNHQRL
jgi:hypothetical protein